MFRAVCALLLFNGLPVTFSESQHANNEGKIRQVVSILHSISQKLATERHKEDLVYNEIKDFCGARKGRNADPQARSRSGIEHELDSLRLATRDAARREEDATKSVDGNRTYGSTKSDMV